MSLRTRMTAVLVLVATALAGLAVGLPDYLHAVHVALASGSGQTVGAPPALVAGALAGLAALVLVLREQHRRTEYGWMTASVLLSYAGIVAYAVRALLRERRAGVRARP